uniref:Uncharacterized protein n=1 Tax=Glycine max TaxID=3847 RepID=C6TN92_SOYBN|nr:unknown [Glycine max]
MASWFQNHTAAAPAGTLDSTDFSISSPSCLHPTSFVPAEYMSPVRNPLFKVSITAFSILSAAFSSPRPYLKSIAALRTVANGFALSCPAISGAEPCMGSKSPGPEAPRLAEGSIPILPVTIEASSDNISPKMLFVTMVSNCFGSRISCIEALSTYMCESSTSGYSCAIAKNLFLHNIDASSTLALSTEQSFDDAFEQLKCKMSYAIYLMCSIISVLKPISSPLSLVPKPLGSPK